MKRRGVRRTFKYVRRGYPFTPEGQPPPPPPPPPPGGGTPASITLTPSQAFGVVGQQATLQATVLDASGVPTTGAVGWQNRRTPAIVIAGGDVSLITPQANNRALITMGTRKYIHGGFNFTAALASYTAGIIIPTPANLISKLSTARAAGFKVLPNFADSRANFKNADGTFSLSKWIDQAITRYTQTMADLQTYVDDWTLLGHYIIDEPLAFAFGGQDIPKSTLDEMCRLARQKWPNLKTYIRLPSVFFGNFAWQFLQGLWGQWEGPHTGTIGHTGASFAAQEVAYAKANGLGPPYFGMNIPDGGDGSSGVPGTFAPGSRWAMSASEILSVGTAFAAVGFSEGQFDWMPGPDYAASYVTWVSSRPGCEASVNTVASRENLRHNQDDVWATLGSLKSNVCVVDVSRSQAGGTSYPNLPAAYTQILEEKFVTAAFVTAGWQPDTLWQSSVVGVVDATSPDATSNCVDTIFPIGTVDSTTPPAAIKTWTGFKKLYCMSRWKILSPFDVHSTLIQHLLQLSTNVAPFVIELGVVGDPAGTAYAKIRLTNPAPAGSGITAGWYDQVAAQVPWTLTTFHTVEALFQQNTGGLANGKLDVWVNGTLVISRTDVEYHLTGAALFSGIRVRETWGRGLGFFTGEPKQTRDVIRLDHLYCAGSNA